MFLNAAKLLNIFDFVLNSVSISEEAVVETVYEEINESNLDPDESLHDNSWSDEFDETSSNPSDVINYYIQPVNEYENTVLTLYENYMESQGYQDPVCAKDKCIEKQQKVTGNTNKDDDGDTDDNNTDNIDEDDSNDNNDDGHEDSTDDTDHDDGYDNNEDDAGENDDDRRNKSIDEDGGYEIPEKTETTLTYDILSNSPVQIFLFVDKHEP